MLRGMRDADRLVTTRWSAPNTAASVTAVVYHTYTWDPKFEHGGHISEMKDA